MFCYHINSSRKHRSGRPQVCCWVKLFGKKIQYRSTIDRYSRWKVLGMCLLGLSPIRTWRFIRALKAKKEK